MSHSLERSAMCLSMHKAGSSICDLILADFFAERGAPVERLALEVPASPLVEPDWFIANQHRLDPGAGVYYGVARGPYVGQLAALRDMSLLIQMRDPRDCITSAYFSFRDSHRPPVDPAKLAHHNARRAALIEQGIDGYALTRIENYAERLTVLREIVETWPHVTLVHYEDMVTDTDRWLDRLAAFSGQPVTEALRARLGPKIDFTVPSEDTTRHKRQVRPGDHRRKLAPDTIATLTRAFRPELDFFGYLGQSEDDSAP